MKWNDLHLQYQDFAWFFGREGEALELVKDGAKAVMSAQKFGYQVFARCLS